MRSQLGPTHILALASGVTEAVNQAPWEAGPGRAQQSYQDLISPLLLMENPSDFTSSVVW